MKFLLSFVMALALCFPVTGCTEDEAVSNAYKALRSSYITYDAVMTSAASMYKSGTLDAEAWGKVADAGLIYLDAYQMGIEIAVSYLKLNDVATDYDSATAEEKRALLNTAVDMASQSLAELVKLAITLGIDVKHMIDPAGEPLDKAA
mgnify:CR=1 FL=1